MTGKAAPMRSRPFVKFKMRVCLHCNAKFQPARSDGKFCQDLCRQAFNRTQKKIDAATIAAEAAAERARVFQQRKKDALEVIGNFEGIQSIAAVAHRKAHALGIDVKFMGTQLGVLAIEGSPGALSAASDKLKFPQSYHREIKTTADNSELKALLSLPAPVNSYFNREGERECLAALKRGANVSLFVEDKEELQACIQAWIDEHPPGRFCYTPPAWNEDHWPRSDDPKDDIRFGTISLAQDGGAGFEDHGAGFEGEFDPRDEPATAEPAMPEDAGVMDYADPFWR